VRHLAGQNKTMSNPDLITLQIPPHMAGQRLDQGLAALVQDYSRARLQQWIKAGKVRVDGKVLRPKDKLYGNETVIVEVEHEAVVDWQAEDIPVEIIFEDEAILVINKPAGMVVHPAVGNENGTLVNGLLHHAPELAEVPRSGIIHRLDKDTTGLLVVARTPTAHKVLVERLQAREVKREYEAVVSGVMTAGGTVDAPMGRHPVNRKNMAVLVSGGKHAVTHYRVEQRFRAHTHIRVQLETGRTHQIRVHMAHIRYPLVGDQVYGGRLKLPPQCSDELTTMLRTFKRQALHAARLGFLHPLSNEPVEWSADLPGDMQSLLCALSDDNEAHVDDSYE